MNTNNTLNSNSHKRRQNSNYNDPSYQYNTYNDFNFYTPDGVNSYSSNYNVPQQTKSSNKYVPYKRID